MLCFAAVPGVFQMPGRYRAEFVDKMSPNFYSPGRWGWGGLSEWSRSVGLGAFGMVCVCLVQNIYAGKMDGRWMQLDVVGSMLMKILKFLRPFSRFCQPWNMLFLPPPYDMTPAPLPVIES